MPYITEERRAELEPMLRRLDDDLKDLGDVGGDLNYVITRLMVMRVERLGKSYESISSTSKEANKAAQEFDRRVLGSYEDQKMIENGDVYGSLVPNDSVPSAEVEDEVS